MNRPARLGLAIGLLLLTACAGQRPRPTPQPTSASAPPQAARNPAETSLPQDRRYAQSRDGEPDRRIDVATLPEPVPRDEPPSKYGNRSPYSVLGQTYTVLPSARGYVERGTASWYGNKFHGYMTSSFEPYDMYQFTAAHKTLPLPSWVKVTNLANGKSVVVRVNDRGPFHQDRLIDLSYAAAVRIGIWPAGTGRVEVRAVGPRDTAPAPAPTQARAARPAAPGSAAPAPALPPGTAHLYVQVGAYGEPANAQRAAEALRRAGLGEVQVEDANVNGRRLRRVRLGPLSSADEADRVVDTVRRLGLGPPQVAAD